MLYICVYLGKDKENHNLQVCQEYVMAKPPSYSTLVELSQQESRGHYVACI